MRDLATVAGVNVSTVSRAFTRPELLLPATVQRIHELAAQLGYSPNPMGRTLSTGVAEAIGIVVPDISNPFFPPLIRGAQGEADAQHLSVMLGDSYEDPEREWALVRRLQDRTDGVILASSRMGAPLVKELALRGHVVLMNRDIGGIDRVLIDTGAGVAGAVEHLAGLGHRSITYVCGPAGSWSNAQRHMAAAARARTLGVALTDIVAGKPTYEAGRAVAPRLVSSRATAVIAFDDQVASGIMAGVQDLGLAVPADISIVGCDDVIAATTYPPLSTVASGVCEAGARAAALLLARIRGEAGPARRELLPTRFVARHTTAAAREGQPA